MREEVFVSALEDVEFGVEEFGVVVHGAVPLPDEAAHPRAALRGELTVEDDHHSLLWARRDDGGPEEEVLHLDFLVKVQSSLRQTGSESLGICSAFKWGFGNQNNAGGNDTK